MCHSYLAVVAFVAYCSLVDTDAIAYADDGVTIDCIFGTKVRSVQYIGDAVAIEY